MFNNKKPSITTFQKFILDNFRRYGRDLPWRKTHDPYNILVSEIMLQQTQVARVLVKYPQFIKTFPDFWSLAQASLRDILQVWQGMGYNRRAFYLKCIAQSVVKNSNERLLKDEKKLIELPGIGKTTAASVIVFAYNMPSVFIETNIRRVFIYHFFNNKASIHDCDILPLIEKTLDTKNPRRWYWALMDYGAMLGDEARRHAKENPNRRSAHYVKQSKFKGSRRELRGKILSLLLKEKKLSKKAIMARLQIDHKAPALDHILIQLIMEQFLEKKDNYFFIKHIP